MYNSFKNDEHGFTLIEMVVGMAVGMIFLGVAVRLFVLQQAAFDKQGEVTQMQQNIRAAMDMVVREAKMAGYNPTGADITTGITYATDELKIVADIDGDGTTTSSNEEIIYKHYGGTYELKRKSNASGFQPVVENIYAFTFEYLNEDSNATTTSSAIRQIKVTITGKTSKIDSGINDYRYGTLTSFITPVNLDN